MLKSYSVLFLFVTILSYILLCGGDEISDDVPLVRVKQGLIKGIKEKSIYGKEFYSYMSIPFAEVPTGKLRFKDPLPSKSWQGVLDGSKIAPFCLQPDLYDFLSPESDQTVLKGKEDCLYINVHTTAPNQPDKKLQVMVFIHGGALLIGGAQEYPPYVLMNRDIIYVAIQYRVGILGFLSTEDSVMPGNMGLKDQQLALKWVKENIASFGGDPESILLFGASAGAAAVHYQVLSPGSQGLFKRAIIQSGTALCPWASNVNHRKFAIETGRQFNCSLDHGTEEFLDCMQNVNSLYLVISSTNNEWGMVPLYVLPRVDGEFISDSPEILMKEGKYNKVDILMGTSRDEIVYEFMINQIHPERRQQINNNFNKYGPLSIVMQNEENPEIVTRKIYEYYLQREDITITENDNDRLAQMHGDILFKVPQDTVTKTFAINNDVNLYLYQLDHVAEFSLLDLIPGLNMTDVIAHADDALYLFEGGIIFGRPLVKEEDLQIREIMLSMWINFAKTGNPNIAGSGFTWEKATEDKYRHLSITLNPQMSDDTFGEIRKFWSSLNLKLSFKPQRTENSEQVFDKQEL